jgi:molybdopterin synthase catalytic subunit
VIQFGRRRIDTARALRSVADPAAGAIALFLGVVRNHDSGRRVSAIEYEGYPAMAKRTLAALEKDLRKRFTVSRLVLWHRTGRLGVGEPSVLVAASSAHRADAFAAAREGIERIKAGLPVWKREFGRGGALWKEERPLRRKGGRR